MPTAGEGGGGAQRSGHRRGMTKSLNKGGGAHAARALLEGRGVPPGPTAFGDGGEEANPAAEVGAASLVGVAKGPPPPP